MHDVRVDHMNRLVASLPGCPLTSAEPITVYTTVRVRGTQALVAGRGGGARRRAGERRRGDRRTTNQPMDLSAALDAVQTDHRPGRPSTWCRTRPTSSTASETAGGALGGERMDQLATQAGCQRTPETAHRAGQGEHGHIRLGEGPQRRSPQRPRRPARRRRHPRDPEKWGAGRPVRDRYAVGRPSRG